MSGKLTIQQRKFAREYLKDRNGKAAAIRAGYAPKAAASQASRLLTDANVRAIVDAANHKTLSGLEISVERILKERARLAFFDPRKLLTDAGEPLGLHELDDDTAAAIAGMDTATEKGRDGEALSYIRKYKLADKNASLTALEKHLGMYSDSDRGNAVLNIFIHA